MTELQEAGVTKILGPEDWAKEFRLVRPRHAVWSEARARPRR